MSKAKDRR